MNYRHLTKYLWILCIMFAMFLGGCQNKKKELTYVKDKDFLTINIDNLETKQPIYFSSLFNDIKIIPLETNENCMIGHINQLKIFKDYIIVLDGSIAKSIFIFNRDGKYLRKIGNIGLGPGEYKRVHMFSLDEENDRILVLDGNLRKIITYTLDGEFVTEYFHQEKSIFQFCIFNEKIFLDHILSNQNISEYYLSIINLNGKTEDELFPTNVYGKGFSHALNMSNNFFKSDYELRYIRPFFDTIFTINSDSFKPFITLETKNHLNPEDMEYINNLKHSEMKTYLSRECSKFISIFNYIETQDLIYLTYRNNLRTYKLFYYTLINEIICTEKLIDDITYIKFPDFITKDKNCFVSVIENDFLGNLHELILRCKSSEINISESNRRKIDSLTEDSNPVIIIYKTKNINDNSNLLKQE